MTPSFLKLFCSSILCFFLFQACSKKGSEKKFTVAFSQCIGSDAWRKTMLKEMKRELSFYPEIGFLYADAKGNNKTQIAQIRSFLEKEIDLLIVSPNEAEPLTPIVDQAFRNGIPVIVIDRKTSSGLYNAYVGADNHNIGHMAGQYIAQKLQGKGELAILTGLTGSSASIERERGLKSALQNFPELDVRLSLNGQWLREIAADQVNRHTDVLGNVDAIFAFNDQMALGAYQSLRKHLPENAGPIVIGVDALPGNNNGLEQIIKGTLTASMLYPTGGTEAIRIAIAILNRNHYQRDNLLNTLVIDTANAHLMKMQVEKIDSQQQDIDKQQKLLSEQQAIYHNQQSILNILVVSLVLATVFAAIAVYALKNNWKKNRRLKRQNTEILQQQQQVVEMNKKIEEISKAKANFFTRISHEFKTPLTLILAPVEDLLQDPLISSSVREQLLRIKRNGLRLMNLVSELINIQRLAGEKMRLRASPHNINQFLHQIILSFKPLTIKKNITLTLENKADSTQLWFDMALMEKVMYNLLSNAFKFTPRNGRIQLKVEQNTFGDHVMIRVIDNGKGISRSHIEHIFDPFYQEAYNADGSGIGLALVKEIVELHHGQITVSSRENEGSSFTLRLPTGEAHLSEIEKTIVMEDRSRETELFQDVGLSILNAEQELDGEFDKREPCYKAYTLLIIDDNDEIIRFLHDILKNNYSIYTARNADEGMNLATTKVPDLIISDVVMPGKNGIELTRILKNDTRTSLIPIILLSALDSEEQKMQGLKAMADYYLTKPFNVTHLNAAIQNLITSRRELRQRYSSEVSSFTTGSPDSHTDQERRFLNDLSAFVEAHISNPRLSIEDICRGIGVSRVQLYRKIKALLDCSVNDYIMNRRLNKAKYLLQQDITVNDVAVQTGFSSPTYFATLFKKKFGMSPSLFRKHPNKR